MRAKMEFFYKHNVKYVPKNVGFHRLMLSAVFATCKNMDFSLSTYPPFHVLPEKMHMAVLHT